MNAMKLTTGILATAMMVGGAWAAARAQETDAIDQARSVAKSLQQKLASAILAGLSGTDEGFSAFNVAAEQSASVDDVLRLLIELDGFGDAEVVRRLDRATGAAALEVSAQLRAWWVTMVRAGMGAQREEQQPRIEIMPNGDAAGARGAALQALRAVG